MGMVRLLPSICAMLYNGGVADVVLFLLFSSCPFFPFNLSPSPRLRKGKLSPIQVMKIRQGRKASTLITGFEPFGKVIGGMEPEDLAEDLRKICAGATSGGSLPFLLI